MRPAAEAFLEAAYQRAFQGRITRHYPLILALEDERGRIRAAAGVRLAGDGPLFLEQYLDQSIEAAIEAASGARPVRARIAEIGNLASDSPAASPLLFASLENYLRARNCTHVAATATAPLRQIFSRLNLAADVLAVANPARLAEGGADWGRYYELDPLVLAGPIGLPTPRNDA